jgi:protein involved in polysaccharide export with SLBB domain
MLTRATAIVSAIAGVVAILFLAPAAVAQPNEGCGARHHAAASASPRTPCRNSASNVFSRTSPRITLGVGNVVSITIFEAGPRGLFVPSDAGARPGNFVMLPDQVVDTNGNLTVPYAGKIRAVGRTPAEVQEAINEALRCKHEHFRGYALTHFEPQLTTVMA